MTLAFERNGSDATETEAAYRRFIDAYTGAGRKLERRGNVAILWCKTPQDEEAALPKKCLT